MLNEVCVAAGGVAAAALMFQDGLPVAGPDVNSSIKVFLG
jgi:hypothetical protein